MFGQDVVKQHPELAGKLVPTQRFPTAGKGLTDAFGGIHGPKGHIVEAAKVLEACEAFKETDSTGVGAWVREQLANAGLLP